MVRGVQRSGSELGSDPSTPPLSSRSSSLRKNADDVLSPGLLDLHSFDTELLPEVVSLSVFVFLSHTLELFISVERLVSEDRTAKNEKYERSFLQVDHALI